MPSRPATDYAEAAPSLTRWRAPRSVRSVRPPLTLVRTRMSLVAASGVLLPPAVACTPEQIGSDLEFEAVFACGEAIEKRLGKTLPKGWRFLKEEGDGQAVMKAWAPEQDSATTTPDYTCVLVPDPDAQGGVRVVRVDEGRGSG